MALKLYNYKVHTRYFDCVMNATASKVKVTYIFVMLIIWCKIQEKKLLKTMISLRKYIQLKVYSHHIKNVWLSSLTLFLIFWWIELAISRIHRTGYENFIFNFEDIRHRKIVLYQTLIVLFQSSKPVSSRVLVETSQIDGVFYVKCPPNFMRSSAIVKIEYSCWRKVSDIKVTKYFFSVNIFIIKQSMLLTFLWLFKIVRSIT